MSTEFKNIIKVACIYMTTIIGAGFASGQEIVRFFSKYYKGGFYGIILAGILFALIGYIVLDKVYRERIRNYDEFLFPTVGWFLGWVMEVVVALFLFSVFCIMIAGMGGILSDKLSLSSGVSAALIAAVCMVIMMTDIKGVVAMSTLITPILIVGIIGVGLYVIVFKDTAVFNMSGYFSNATDNWFFSALLYVSYNSIMSIVIMCNLQPLLKTRRTGTIAGIAGGLLLCGIALILNTAIFLFYPESGLKAFPVLNIVEKFNQHIGSFYTFILWLAMFTSAITSGYCFVERVKSKSKINSKVVTLLVCILVVPLSCFGFSNLISTIYPIFGYIGLFMIFAVLIQGIIKKPHVFSNGTLNEHK